MQFHLAVLSVWVIGLGDYWLTRELINQVGLRVELNIVARVVASYGGLQLLLCYKVATLAIFTAAVTAIWRRSKKVAMRTARFAVVVSGLLEVWWAIVLS